MRDGHREGHCWGSEIDAGDVLIVLGTPNGVASIRPYSPSNNDFVDERWRVAQFGGGGGITLDPDACHEQRADGAWGPCPARRPSKAVQ